MKRLILLGALVAVAAAPASVSAQDDAAASQAPLGVTTFDVCLAISGPVIQITPQVLTEGITNGTFVIEGLSNDCDEGLQAADDDSGDDMDDMDDDSDDMDEPEEGSS